MVIAQGPRHRCGDHAGSTGRAASALPHATTTGSAATVPTAPTVLIAPPFTTRERPATVRPAAGRRSSGRRSGGPPLLGMPARGPEPAAADSGRVGVDPRPAPANSPSRAGSIPRAGPRAVDCSTGLIIQYS